MLQLHADASGACIARTHRQSAADRIGPFRERIETPSTVGNTRISGAPQFIMPWLAETIRLVFPENDIVTSAPKVHGAEVFAAEITLKN